MRQIVLASSSPYRKQLLQQLGIKFVSASPPYFEEIDPQISPELQVRHLALRKAESLANHFPDALIIGSDQLFTDPRQRILGKPGTYELAVQQLKGMVGKRCTFYTGVAIYDSASGAHAVEHGSFTVTLRQLSDEQLRYYLLKEQPFDCAGSFRVEGLGISLMAKMEGDDYTCLIGLPLIRLTAMLQEFGVDVLGI